MCSNCAKFWIFLQCIVLIVPSEAKNDISLGYYGKKAIWTVYLDFAAEALSKANNSSLDLHDSDVNFGQKESLMSYLEIANVMIKKAKNNFPSIDNCYTSPQPIRDCSDLLRMGDRRSGVYTISPRKKLTEEKTFNVYCDMETDGGGWTVVQRRGNFYYPGDYFCRDWISYKEGFGDLEKELWLGNDKIFALTNQEMYSVRFDLEDFGRNTRYAHYDEFWIDGENSKYTLHISGYSGTAGDSMEYHNNQKFSTKDQDNDARPGSNCAVIHKGGWWFKDCYRAHLNEEKPELEPSLYRGRNWNTFTENLKSLERTEIKIRPKNLMS